MAVPAKFISFLFVLSLVSSLQVNARDSQFFSKVTHDNIPNEDTEFNRNVKETEVPANEGEETNLNKKEQEPSFVQETQNSYGLYGHETGQLPPSQTKYAPYTTTATGYTGGFNSRYTRNPDDTKYYSKDQPQTFDYNGGNMYRTTRNKHDNVYFSGENSYTGQQADQYMGNDIFTEKGWSTEKNENEDGYFSRGNMYNKHGNGIGKEGSSFKSNGYSTMADQNDNFYFNGAKNKRYNGVQRQGMSDTRFVENGKYYYDVSKDNYIPNQFESNEYRNRGNGRFYENNKALESYRQEESEENHGEEFVP